MSINKKIIVKNSWYKFYLVYIGNNSKSASLSFIIEFDTKISGHLYDANHSWLANEYICNKKITSLLDYKRICGLLIFPFSMQDHSCARQQFCIVQYIRFVLNSTARCWFDCIMQFLVFRNQKPFNTRKHVLTLWMLLNRPS